MQIHARLGSANSRSLKKPGFLAGWNHASAQHKSQGKNLAFEEGNWGVEIYEGLEPDVLGNGDVVVSKHWSSRYVLSFLQKIAEQEIIEETRARK